MPAQTSATDGYKGPSAAPSRGALIVWRPTAWLRLWRLVHFGDKRQFVDSRTSVTPPQSALGACSLLLCFLAACRCLESLVIPTEPRGAERSEEPSASGGTCIFFPLAACRCLESLVIPTEPEGPSAARGRAEEPAFSFHLLLAACRKFLSIGKNYLFRFNALISIQIFW